MKNKNPESPELSAILNKMALLIDFQGVTLTGVNDRSILGDTPLHFAVVWGDIHVGKILLDAGSNPNIQGEYGYTPLHEAILRNNQEFVKLLLEHNAFKDLKNDDGLTASDLARKSNDPIIKAMVLQ